MSVLPLPASLIRMSAQRVAAAPFRRSPADVVAPAEPEASKPKGDARQRQSANLGFLESARMDREMARELHQSYPGRQASLSMTGALLTMSNRRFLILVSGALLVSVGLLALRFPVFLADFDQWGFQINCGSGLQSSITQAGVADSTGTHFVDQCHSAVAMRRVWSVPVLVSGVLLLGALLLAPPRRRAVKPYPEIDLTAV
jgi:hypothetical protein